MELKNLKIEQANTELGGCCDKEMGPKVLQLTAQDKETGKKYYCCYAQYPNDAEFIVAGRDVLHAVANGYDEDVIPYRLERYRLDRPEEAAALEQSACFGCYETLKAREWKDDDKTTVWKSF